MLSNVVNFIKNNPAFIPFVLVQTVFYVLMHFVQTGYTIEIMYGSIILCFLYATISIKFSWDTSHFIWLGLVFTCIADFFLVVATPTKQVEGVFCFTVTQLLYFTYIFLKEKRVKMRKIHVLVRTITSLVCVIAPFVVLKENVDLLSVLSMFYVCNLAINVVFAFLQSEERLFGVGLLLFIMCDLAVGFCAGAGVYFDVIEGGIIDAVVNSDLNVAWLFYLPSQVIISIFLSKNFKKSKEIEKQKEIYGE